MISSNLQISMAMVFGNVLKWLVTKLITKLFSLSSFYIERESISKILYISKTVTQSLEHNDNGAINGLKWIEFEHNNSICENRKYVYKM